MNGVLVSLAHCCSLRLVAASNSSTPTGKAGFWMPTFSAVRSIEMVLIKCRNLWLVAAAMVHSSDASCGHYYGHHPIRGHCINAFSSRNNILLLGIESRIMPSRSP